MDTVTATVRSRIMSRIKQKDSKLEVALRKSLWSAGVRYRKNVRQFGTPDIVVTRHRLVVFVDSCFWHGCRWHCRRPKTNKKFWNEKIARNKRRDRLVTRYYRRRGWTVLRFWEHQLQELPSCVEEVLRVTGAGQIPKIRDVHEPTQS